MYSTLTTFATIDSCALDQVTGGGSSSAEGNIGLKYKDANLGVSGKLSQTDYAKCVGTVAGMKGSTPADLRAACGLPPSEGRRGTDK